MYHNCHNIQFQFHKVVSGSPQSDEGVMSDVCDGDYYRSHPIFRQSDKTLQIFGYYDELVLTNPLMSRRNKYKIAKFNHTLIVLYILV